MHLVVDAQCLQTDTVERGIGRYSLRLLRALREAPGLRLTILLNEFALSTYDDRLLSHLDSFPGGAPRIRRFHTHSARMLQFTRFRLQAIRAREEAIIDLGADAVLILSAFQSERQTVLAPRALTRSVPTAAILYDLIPLVFESHFLYTPSLRHEYLSRLAVLKDCDALLSISRATQEAWVTHVGASPPSYVIGGASDSSESGVAVLPMGARRGVLCLGGETPNKNLGVLLRAHAALPQDLRSQHPLTITGIRQSGFAQMISSRYPGNPEELHIPGYVSESALQHLLASSRVLVMPSTMEGLGLPVAEAATFGTPSLVARGTSLQELNRSPDLAFNAADSHELQALMKAVLTDDEIWDKAHKTALADSARSSWEDVAKATVSALARFDA